MKVTPLEEEVEAMVRQKVLSSDFPCVAAKSLMNRQRYHLGVYEQLGDMAAAVACCDDVYAFSQAFPCATDGFSSFLAVFTATEVRDELHFEQLLWRHLQKMHEVDARRFAWSPAVSSDPDSPEFSFSIGGRAFFMVGMHPKASRQARRAPYAIIGFNPHEQFEQLRSRGQYERMQTVIRQKELATQGSINPVLNDFGQAAESRQYSGRAVGSRWQCPFHALDGDHSNSKDTP
jgi:FPC/CPF motif-containing protein YcgG